MYSLIEKNGVFSSDNYFLTFIPALAYPFIRKKNPQLNILYGILLLHVAVAFFWQIRAANLCFILSAPLQAYVLIEITKSMKYELTKSIFLISGIPIIILIGLVIVNPIPSKNTSNFPPEVTKLGELLKEHDIYEEKILSGITTGAKILAKSDNSIIAAPYHRNINGNILAIATFQSTDDDFIKRTLKKNNINYIIINNDNQLEYIIKSSNEKSLINRLTYNSQPDWLELLNKNQSDGYRIFIFKGL
ncbi:hypothetical protein VCO01S_36160 [Vibrio comitans NBRC 102076]|uniref:Glycosyltransferase RgtA/B/C/D-like domain-containing protein n=2 Tax=Vibrio comitans TaxID=413401 RepID=A0A4Y3ISD2_9VIBR|nr:hypothetical protein VCO01S_36160 [Vibrio comitans NBRC 102076]